ncbi:MAG: peptidylprolyl isomerase [Actinomycetota bacterium]|nr:peptidylprolyl isomerase [Actinomycetota bacterium]
MKRSIIFIFMLFIISLLFAGCSKTAATVDGEKISQKEVDEFTEIVKNQDETGEFYSSEEQINQLEADIIDSLIVIELIEKYAGENSINVTDEEIDEQVQSMIEDYQSEEEFEEALKEMGMSREFLAGEVRSRLLGNKVYEAVTEGTSVTDSDVEQYYEDNKDTDFLVPASIEAAHILAIFPWNVSGSGESESEEGKGVAREKIEEVRQKLDEGENFEEVAGLYSDDVGTAEDGGYLGYVSEGQMVEEFNDALFSLDEGEVSDIVETEYGFHIIKAYEYREEYIQEFEEVEESIREFLLSSYKGAEWEDFIYSLINEADIEYFSDVEGSLVNTSAGEES